MPLARAVLAPAPSSPRAPEPPGALPSHGARWRRACSAPDVLIAGPKHAGADTAQIDTTSIPGSDEAGQPLPAPPPHVLPPRRGLDR